MSKFAVKVEGNSFAEMVMDLNEKLNPDQKQVKVKFMKKTKMGDLLLEVERRDKASILKDKISKEPERRVKTVGR